MKHKITVLGQEYQIVQDTPENNPKLNKWNGYHEPQAKKIVIDSTIATENNEDDMGIENIDAYIRHIYRHEILHAFFCESGITYRYDKDEEDFLVDWIARQFPKMKKIFEELNVAD